MRTWAFLFVVFAASLVGEEYQFRGRHYLASYLECDLSAIRDSEALLAVMDEAVAASGATILQRAEHHFSPSGATVVYLLSESHASIHTYSERGACFVDLFTCGEHCSHQEFDRILRAYLKPQRINAQLIDRDDQNKEMVWWGSYYLR